MFSQLLQDGCNVVKKQLEKVIPRFPLVTWFPDLYFDLEILDGWTKLPDAAMFQEVIQFYVFSGHDKDKA